MQGIWMAFAGLFLFSAAHAADAPGLRTVAQGYHSGLDKPEQRVIRTTAEWDKLWAAHSARTSEKTPPPVDFSKEMVLAAFMGTRNTGGYSVQITDVKVVGRKLVATVQEKKPGRGSINAQVITSPFHMAAVKASKLPVEWRVEGDPPAAEPKPDPTLR